MAKQRSNGPGNPKSPPVARPSDGKTNAGNNNPPSTTIERRGGNSYDTKKK